MADAPITRTQGYGGHSMSAPLRRVVVRQPAPPADQEQWREFHYARAVDHEPALSEHAALVQLFEAEGINVVVETGDPVGLLDTIFGYDPSIMTDRGAILLRPGKSLREV